MQNVLALAPAIAKTSSFGSAAGKGRTGLVDARDVAAVAAEIAACPAAHAGQTQAFSLAADGDAEWVTQDIPSLLGRPARSFHQFARDYATAFS
jgi:uncharacterized protein YbjT (DUF2867 family)